MVTQQNPVLILIRGLPGSGKSYLAERLNEALHKLYGQDSTVMLDPDASDYNSKAYKQLVTTLTEQQVDPKFHPYRFLRGQAHQGIETNKVIIWNQPFTNFDGFNKTVINLTNHATEHAKQLPILVVEVQTDPELAKSRVKNRKAGGGHGPSDQTFERFNREYESFAKHGFTTIQVSGHANTKASIATILDALNKL